MSALGQKRTWPRLVVMSALPPKADMCGATTNVCFGPIADSCGATKSIKAALRQADTYDREVFEGMLR